MKKGILIILLILLKTLLSEAQDCVDSIHLRIIPEHKDNKISADISVSGFKDVSSFQFAINFDPDVFRLDSLYATHQSLKDLLHFDNKKGTIRIIWTNPIPTVGITLADNSVLIKIRFIKIKAVAISHITLSNSQLPGEFTKPDNKMLCHTFNMVNVPTEQFYISGKVIFDENSNCVLDQSEKGLSEWMVEFDTGAEKYYQITDAQGKYLTYLPKGKYTIRIYPKNESWSPCINDLEENIEDKNIDNVNFIVKPKVICPLVKVDISTPFVHHCEENIYTLVYKNFGNTVSENTIIEVNFDRNYTFLRSTANPLTIKQNTLLFSVGDLLPVQGDTIRITFKSECGAISMGRTYCVSAKAAPLHPCTSTSEWNGSDIQIIPQCDDIGKKVHFIIKNNGNGDMLDIKHYIVTEEDVLKPSQPFKLDKQKELKIELPADGTSYRLTADQDGKYPFKSKSVSSVLEGCGTDVSGNFSKGFIVLFEETDRDEFIDTDCRESDVNISQIQMTGMPKGYGNQHYIATDAYPEFVLTFQNPDVKDKICNVILKTKINENFDLKSLEIGPSGHPYKYYIDGNRELVFIFENIYLSGRLQNLAGSLGFVKYKIKVNKNVVHGTRINNEVKLFFNYDDIVISPNQYYTIGQNFIIASTDYIPEHANIKLYPNPFNDVMIIDIPDPQLYEYSYSIKSIDGQEKSNGKLHSGQNVIITDGIRSGLNLLYITTPNIGQSVYKIIKL